MPIVEMSVWKEIKKDIDDFLKCCPDASTEDIARALSVCGWHKYGQVPLCAATAWEGLKP